MNKKMVFMVLFFTVLGVVSAYAGTTDTLGMEGTYNKITAILTDKYLNPVIVIALFYTDTINTIALGLAGLMFLIMINI